MNIYGRFYRVWNYFSDLVILTLLWAGTSILGLGITFGASTTATYHVLFKLIDSNKDYYVFREYIEAFKRNFKPATIVWLMMVTIFSMLTFSIHFALKHDLSIYYLMCLAVLLMAGLSFIYIFPIVAKFEAKVKDYMVSSLLMASKHLGVTVLLVGSIVGLIFLFFITNGILIAVIPGMYLLYSGFLLRRVFRHYENQIEIIGGESDVI